MRFERLSAPDVCRSLQIRIDVEAPKETPVHREEIYERIKLERAN